MAMSIRMICCSIAVAVIASGCAQRAVVPSPSAPISFTNGTNGVTPFNLTAKDVVSHFPLPNPSTDPSDLALGSDKNVWFTELNFSKIGRIKPNGAVSEFVLPGGHFGAGIAAGATGTLWFTEFGAGFIGKITTTGTVTEFPAPASAFTEGICKGPDGNMWFTDSNNNAVGKITPTGNVTEFPLLTNGANPRSIVTGPDGNLWVVETGPEAIARVTPTGTVTEFKGAGDNAYAITVGANGKLYASSANGIWQITTAGAITESIFSGGPTVWTHIILGPDKQMWMTSQAFGALIEFNPSTHKFSSSIQPDIVNGSPGVISGLTIGSDGDVWIAGQTGNDILVYEEKVYSVGIRLNGELSFTDPNYGFELGYAVGTGTQTQTLSLAIGESVQFTNLDTIPHSAAFLGKATSNGAPWPASFNGSTTPSPAFTAIGTTGWATGPLNPGTKSVIYETGLPGFYMIGCQFHYNTHEMRTVVVVH